MRATGLNCSLKRSSEASNTGALMQEVLGFLRKNGVRTEEVRMVDLNVPVGVKTTMNEDDDWPSIHQKIVESEILVIASPTWVGNPSSIAQKVLERMDAMLTETDDQGRPINLNRVAGVVSTGNQDGAKHVIADIESGLVQLGFTIPGNSYTFWNQGPSAGKNYLETDHGHKYSKKTAEQAAHVLLSVAKALKAKPIPYHPSMTS